jgi:Ca-activated chloride channel family protein
LFWSQTPAPPRNRPALAITLAASVVIFSIVYVANRDCIELVVASSQEKSGLLKDIAADYEQTDPRVDRRCIDVTVNEMKSGDAESALANDWAGRDEAPPHVWSPAATSWVQLLEQHRTEKGLKDIVPVAPPSLMLSPLVLATLEPMAEVLRQTRIGWTDIIDFVQDRNFWARYGKDWGPFLLGNTRPTTSTSGLHALIALDYSVKNAPPQPGDVNREDVRTVLCNLYSRVIHETDSAGEFLTNWYAADQQGTAMKYASAIAVEEKQVFEYNRGNPASLYPPPTRPEPNVRLWAIYPKEGLPVANHPYVVLNASWVGPAEQAAASDFFSYLESTPVQRRFRSAGFRDHLSAAGPEIAPPRFQTHFERALESPGGEALAELQRSRSELRVCAGT